MAAGWDSITLRKWLNAIGIKRHLKGFDYFAEAVRISLDDASLLYEITKGMYPRIADKYDTTAECVERSMRHAICSAWKDEKCNIRNMFAYKPTNGTFIRYVTYRFMASDAEKASDMCMVEDE